MRERMNAADVKALQELSDEELLALAETTAEDIIDKKEVLEAAYERRRYIAREGRRRKPPITTVKLAGAFGVSDVIITNMTKDR